VGRDRGRYEATDRDIEDLAYHGGNVNALHRARPTGGPSVDTLRRAFARALTPGQRAGMKGGEPARRLYDTFLTRATAHRNEAWEADHTQLAIEVIFPDGRVGAPWLTLFVECFSHGIAGWAIADQPTQESVLAALRAGILTEPPYGPIGGVPTAIRWDRGKEFLASAITDAATALAIDAHPLPPYSPERKGGVERANRSIEQLHLAGLPGYLHRARNKSGRRTDENDPLLTLDAFVTAFASFVREFNEERPHEGIDGDTPVARWRSDATPLVQVPAERLHHLLLARVPRRVGRSGIRLFGASYNSAELVGRVGENVEVRYARHQLDRVEVFLNDTFLCTAYLMDAIEEEAARRILAQRAKEATWLAAKHRAAARRRRDRFAPITQARPDPKQGKAAPPRRTITPSRSLLGPRQVPPGMVRPPGLDAPHKGDSA
jgi:putative transposase